MHTNPNPNTAFTRGQAEALADLACTGVFALSVPNGDAQLPPRRVWQEDARDSDARALWQAGLWGRRALFARSAPRVSVGGPV